ncbi:MAG: hypothetical protein BI182_08270 [Acetobacterium sp. MES1]|uniref:Cas9 inhibitor AcrIIA9 family protein n=1 Tax=Acetobacterium sp. MES1 TaxID=1899015 RepID=UPI000B9CB402|nr:Cas9 inhibitor AcrIIA9 family protein [Acetobacterium sp. MES1]OXS26382.1 MAG: hypothetical protein BI182_08270 [Acetobacterium sp. MES1]
MIEQAKNKLKEESKNLKISGQKEKAIAPCVLKALLSFCDQEVFSQAVLEEEKNFGDCLKYIVTGTGNSISDLDVYKKAASYYIPNAGIEFKMIMTIGENLLEVDHDGKQPGAAEKDRPEKKKPEKKEEKKQKPKAQPMDPRQLEEAKLTMAKCMEERQDNNQDIKKAGGKQIIQFDIFGNEVIL